MQLPTRQVLHRGFALSEGARRERSTATSRKILYLLVRTFDHWATVFLFHSTTTSIQRVAAITPSPQQSVEEPRTLYRLLLRRRVRTRHLSQPFRETLNTLVIPRGSLRQSEGIASEFDIRTRSLFSRAKTTPKRPRTLIYR